MWPCCTTICCRSGCHCLFWAAVIILQPRQAWASFHASLYTILPAEWAFRLLWVNIILFVLDWNKECNSWTDPVIAVPVTIGMIPFIVQRCDNQCERRHIKGLSTGPDRSWGHHWCLVPPSALENITGSPGHVRILCWEAIGPLSWKRSHIHSPASLCAGRPNGFLPALLIQISYTICRQTGCFLCTNCFTRSSLWLLFIN